ncbi:hypothetical protein WMF37_46215 [Sorangium sp. So ce291]|uniref:hypothetical protein n=1 Tax=Sorangium sp. So ce291 TaxID=3133294 RepID=UPI003F63316C
MKSRSVMSALTLTAFAFASNASALQINSHGASFQPYNARDATSIDYVAAGVRTLATTPTYVITSLDHNTSTTGHKIYIDGAHYSDGLHPGTQTTTCTVYSHNYDGTMLASVSASASSVSGSWERIIDLTADQSPKWAYFSVLCSIPANKNGVLLGVTST